MFTFKEEVKTPIPNPIITHIESDVREFVEQELILYKQNPDNTRLDDSVIVNLALFNLEALKYQKGYDQMINLLSDHHNQIVGQRMKQLLHTLCIRYGISTVEAVSESTISSMIMIYDLDKSIVAKLDEDYNTFWLQPFIRLAYSQISSEFK